nr:helix-turn-helix transcriptional regulator [Planotetraspora thailandica]
MKSPLGEFLRARRQVVGVDQVGLPSGDDRRRTPGLRRNEVALLAGVSVDYYTRLEQGRERNPSDQVLDALAGALQLCRLGTGGVFVCGPPSRHGGSRLRRPLPARTGR